MANDRILGEALPAIRPHRPTLGTFRLILAVTVFWSHIAPRAFHFLYTMTHGFIAVLVFFIISGYLISNALETFYSGRVGEFAINRAVRLYPCYWIVLIADILICKLYLDPMPGFGGAATLTLLGASWKDLAWAFLSFNIIAMTWSLRAELGFYITAAIVSMLAGFVSQRARPIFIYSCCWIALAFYVWIAATQDLPWADSRAFIPYFVVGVAISRIGLRRDNPSAAYVLLGVAIALAYVAFDHTATPEPHHRFFTHVGLRLGPDPYNIVNFAILLAGLAICLFIDVRGRLRTVDNFLGDLSYPLFISHYTINATIGYTFGFLPDRQRMWLSFFTALCVAVALCCGVDRRLVWLRDVVRGVKLYGDQRKPQPPRQILSVSPPGQSRANVL